MVTHGSMRGALALVLAALGLSASGCGSSMSVKSYMSDRKIGDDPSWKALVPGQRLAIFDPKGNCGVPSGETKKELDEKPDALGRKTWAGRLTEWTVKSSVVKPDERRVVVELEGSSGLPLWVELPGKDPSCVYPFSDALAAAKAKIGKTVAFTPWKPTCTTLEIAGLYPDYTLLAHAQRPMVVEELEIGAASAQSVLSWAPGKGPYAPWLQLSGGQIHVRSDVLDGCFTAYGDPSATPADPLSAQLGIDLGRCQSTTTPSGKKALRCGTTLSVWEGAESPNALSLSRVRRTLGAFHVLDGEPVDAGQAPRATVGINVRGEGGRRERVVFEALSGTLGKVASTSAEDLAVKLVKPSDPAASSQVEIVLRNVVVSDVKRSEGTDSSVYGQGSESRPNDKKIAAIAEYKKVVAEVKAAIPGCKRELAAGTKGPQCQIAAKGANRMDALEKDINKMPDNITTGTSKTWTYKKVVYTRSITAEVETIVRLPTGTERQATKVEVTKSDYDVDADPAHNVPGHRAARDFLDDPDTMLPALGEKSASAAANELRSALAKSAMAESLRKIVAAGVIKPRPGFELVDASAYELAGTRLRAALTEGEASSGSASLPVTSVQLGPDECLVAVAAADDPKASMTLVSAGNAYADPRGQRVAAVEICKSEVPNGVPELSLKGSGGKARWALYRAWASGGH